MPAPTISSNPFPLCGRLVGIGRDAVVHSVHLRDGHVSYHGRCVRTDARVHNLVAFGSLILAFGDDSPAYELSTVHGTLRCVDLAGRGRTVAAYPKHDSVTGELHLVARDTDGGQTHVVVSPGAFTRRSRPVLDTPSRIAHLTLTDDHVVFVADGCVGVAPREGEARAAWIETGADAPRPVLAHDADDAVVLLVLTPALERWTLQLEDRKIQREVLDPRRRRFAGEVDGCRLLELVHDPSGVTTDLCVIDAGDIAAPAIATVRIVRPIPLDLDCTWIPSTPNYSSSPKENKS